MSRLNNIFHNQTNCNKPAAAEAPAPDPAPPADTSLIDSAVNYATESTQNAEAEASSLVDKLKPKLQEIVKEINDEEQKLCVEVNKLDIVDACKKLPVLPKIAHNLPDRVKAPLKKALTGISQRANSAAKPGASGNANGPVSARLNAAQQLCDEIRHNPEGLIGTLNTTAASVQQRSSNALCNLKNSVTGRIEELKHEAGSPSSLDTGSEAHPEPAPGPASGPVAPAEPIVTH